MRPRKAEVDSESGMQATRSPTARFRNTYGDLSKLVEWNALTVAVHGSQSCHVDDHWDQAIGRDALHAKFLSVGSIRNNHG